MKTIQAFGCLCVLLIGAQTAIIDIPYDANQAPLNETVYKAYLSGVDMGIINPEKYPFDSFERHEQDVFRDLFEQYRSFNGSEAINYQEWLVMNNFGVLPDTQEPLLMRKISKRGTAENKRQFMDTVKKGDILISSGGWGGFVGHAAIMTSDYWVLEMPGGKDAGSTTTLHDNNHQIPKGQYFDNHASDWTTVYRCPDSAAAVAAARWADRNYYSPSGGEVKEIHIDYRITGDIWSKNPSYCSKLPVQAYYFGTGSKQVIGGLSVGRVVPPAAIPGYFLNPYKLVNKGKF